MVERKKKSSGQGMTHGAERRHEKTREGVNGSLR